MLLFFFNKTSQFGFNNLFNRDFDKCNLSILIYYLFYLLINIILYQEQSFPNCYFKSPLLKKVKRIMPPQTRLLIKLLFIHLRPFFSCNSRIYSLSFKIFTKVQQKFKIYPSSPSPFLPLYYLWPLLNKIALVWSTLIPSNYNF